MPLAWITFLLAIIILVLNILAHSQVGS